MDSASRVGIDKSIRLRVALDVRRPLVKSVRLKMANGREEDFMVKYEKPPLYCYFYGKLGHGLKDCEACEDSDEPHENYGGWLKASPWKRAVNGEAYSESKPTRGKVLFVTKPTKKQTITSVVEVEEVINKLGEVGIGRNEGVDNQSGEG
ncbi:UDP-N-acetylenolpyruvoylglucosamine reductase [Bienertia sinuspersici]